METVSVGITPGEAQLLAMALGPRYQYDSDEPLVAVFDKMILLGRESGPVCWTCGMAWNRHTQFADVLLGDQCIECWTGE